MNVEASPSDESAIPLTADQGGGPPTGMPWTLELDGEDGWSADLEHPAPLPRAGERIEFIGEDGRRARYRVTDVVHTLQASASERPRVKDEQSGPNSIVTDAPARVPRSLRAGLPRVRVTSEDDS